MKLIKLVYSSYWGNLSELRNGVGVRGHHHAKYFFFEKLKKKAQNLKTLWHSYHFSK